MSLADFYSADDRPHYVYRVYDALNQLLYVGCSIDVDQRMANHEGTSAWFVFHSRVEKTAYSTREEAEAAEANAIATEHPRWNINGRSVDHPDGFARSAKAAHWLAAERDMGTRWRKIRAEERDLEERLAEVRGRKAVLEAQLNVHPAIAQRDAGLTVTTYRRSA